MSRSGGISQTESPSIMRQTSMALKKSGKSNISKFSDKASLLSRILIHKEKGMQKAFDGKDALLEAVFDEEQIQILEVENYLLIYNMFDCIKRLALEQRIVSASSVISYLAQ
jgi:hypothetical protein